MSDLPAATYDPSEIHDGEFHPAAASAYRWLKGFMITNPDDYVNYKLMLDNYAASGNRQAQIALGTIARLRDSKPVSDRYLLGLAWTILYLHNRQAMESVADKRFDKAYPHTEAEL